MLFNNNDRLRKIGDQLLITNFTPCIMNQISECGHLNAGSKPLQEADVA